MILEAIRALILIAMVIVLALLILPTLTDKNREYKVFITYTTGERDTMTLIGSYPKIGKSGCVYDYTADTYICGVRKITVTEVGR